jgi:Glyoxalase-like domain
VDGLKSDNRPDVWVAPIADSLRDYARHWTPVHIDFEVPRLEEAVKHALAAGATLEREIQVQGSGRMANMADPFGHGFCFSRIPRSRVRRDRAFALEGVSENHSSFAARELTLSAAVSEFFRFRGRRRCKW